MRSEVYSINLLRESFSPSGFELARNILKLNESMREITGSDEELGEWLYWLSVLGEPSPDEPWGWQYDGHHLNVNCFLVGGQMAMTPMFMGSEPVDVDIGKHREGQNCLESICFYRRPLKHGGPFRR